MKFVILQLEELQVASIGFDVTKNQLLEAGAKFTGLDVGNKPNFDILIDDKAINVESYFLIQEKIST